MKRVFLDTNILVDYVLGREHGDDAEQLLQHGKNGTVSLSASYLTFANMAYILKGDSSRVPDRTERKVSADYSPALRQEIIDYIGKFVKLPSTAK